jgi:hypothetical protein
MWPEVVQHSTWLKLHWCVHTMQFYFTSSKCGVHYSIQTVSVLLILRLSRCLRNLVPTDWTRTNMQLLCNFSILTLCTLIQVGSLPTGGSFIIMEFIQFGRSRGDQVTLSRNPFHTKKKVTLHLIFQSFVWILYFEQIGYCQSALGRKLAEMHKAAKSDKGYGFHVENTIGRYS